MHTESLSSVLDKILAPDPTQPAVLLAAIRALDAWVAARGAELDPHFRHYLEKRSYAKAHAWVAEHGEPAAWR